MPKKIGTSSGAKAKREESPKELYEEDEGGGRNRPSRAQKKREEKAESRVELAAKKAEARRLAEQEATELVKKVRKQKLTEADRLRIKEEALAAQQREEEKRKKEARRLVDEKDYAGMVCVANTNRAISDLEARNVDEAIAQLVGGRMSAHAMASLFKAFEEKEMERVKKEKPGLTLTKYKDEVKKLWNKSPENPLNYQQVVMVDAKKKNQTTARNQMRDRKAITIAD